MARMTIEERARGVGLVLARVSYSQMAFTTYRDNNQDLVEEKETRNKLMEKKMYSRSSDVSDKQNRSFCSRSESLSFDWSEFEQVYASDHSKNDGFERLTSFLGEVSKIVVKYLRSERDQRTKVLDFHHPHQLRDEMGHCLEVDENPRDLEQILSDCKETLKYCVKTAHPHFLNQLSTGLDIIGMAAEWLTAAANTNMFTYELAPVFTLMEEVVLQRMLDMIGFNHGEAIFAPGGSISNLYGMLCARHSANPDIKVQGLTQRDQFVVFTSKQSHYSIKKAAILLGIGLQNVVEINTDKRGRMLARDLESAINEAVNAGKRPLLVNATCGTTVLGAYDPVNDVADVCERNNVWLHIDAAWGGGALFSQKHKRLMTGVERADSLTWNPHKMMGVPLQCSAIFLKKKGILLGVNQIGADYLFQKDKVYNTAYDTGDKAIQCGRHNDIFKLWLMWRSKGDKGFEAQIDRNFAMAKYLLDKLKRRNDFELVNDELEGPNVCFWYVPDNVSAIKDIQDRRFHLHTVASKLKGLMMEKGSMMIQYQPLGDLPNFFRIAFSNPAITQVDIDFVIEELAQLGQQLNSI